MKHLPSVPLRHSEVEWQIAEQRWLMQSSTEADHAIQLQCHVACDLEH